MLVSVGHPLELGDFIAETTLGDRTRLVETEQQMSIFVYLLFELSGLRGDAIGTSRHALKGPVWRPSRGCDRSGSHPSGVVAQGRERFVESAEDVFGSNHEGR